MNHIGIVQEITTDSENANTLEDAPMAVEAGAAKATAPAPRLSCHLFTATRTFAARVDTTLHIAHAFAVFRTLAAYLCAFTARMLVMLGANQHEMR